MLTTNYSFLENELMDVVRLFKGYSSDVAHTLFYAENTYRNVFVADGETYTFEDTLSTNGEIEFKRYAKRFAKLGLYKILSKKFNITMPWGALTGIRPTKLAYTELAANRSYLPLFSDMGVSKENVRLIEDILRAQEGIYERKDGNCDLFVSIPFCPSKCVYCSFITADIRYTRKYLDEYMQKMVYELKNSADLIGNLRSVYVGGGTPLVLEEEYLKTLLEAVAPLRKNGSEYTVEAGRPDVFTDGKLQLLKDYGVTRICVNPQSLVDKTLERIGRKHTAKDVYLAYDQSKKYGFDINMDLIAGLTGESYEEFVYSLKEAIALEPENITVHSLCLKSGAKLKEECEFLDGGEISRMITTSRALLRDAGYEPYYMYRQKYQAGNQENTGWTKKGKACVYNVDIMEEIADNLAVGANAVSKKVYSQENRIERYGSPKDFQTYFDKIDEVILKKHALFKGN
ncbi:MAG: coproporphyrinogen dehydrogenase HemZ [Clostridia bacterium]|nr:coproporphyrinogen dehydrogenase HemZ [Clostridia bacterium]